MLIFQKIKNLIAKFFMVATFAIPCAQALTVDLGSKTSPTTFNYENTFTSPTPAFVDWFGFSIDASDANLLTATIGLSNIFNIANLQTRLYKGYVDSSGVHNLGWLATGQDTHISQNGYDVILNTIAPMSIGSGQYLIKVTGNATGVLGGSYRGAANFITATTVPVLGVLPLLLSGMAFFGVYFRRKQH
jgi:hypothetical protein